MALFPSIFIFWDTVIRMSIYFLWENTIQSIIPDKIGRSSNNLTTNSPLPLLLWIRSPSQTTLLVMGIRHCTYLSLNNGFYFPASLWYYSNKTITFFHKNQWSLHPLVNTKYASYNLCLIIYFPSATPGALHNMQCPPAPGL